MAIAGCSTPSNGDADGESSSDTEVGEADTSEAGTAVNTTDDCECADPCTCDCAPPGPGECPGGECLADADCGPEQTCFLEVCNPQAPQCDALPHLGAAMTIDLGELTGEIVDLEIGDLDDQGPAVFVAMSDRVIAVRDGEVIPLFADVSATRLRIGDVDGDGVAEIATSADTGLGLWRREQDGTTWSLVASDDLGGASVRSFALADHDGDGLLDLIVQTSSGFSSLPGTMQGTLGAAIVIGEEDADGTMRVADVDGDGTGDVVYAEGDGYHVILGGGAGTTSLDGVPSDDSLGLLAADFDANGATDLAEVFLAGHLRMWRPALGIGGLTAQLGGNVRMFGAVDVNGDAHDDLVVVDPFGTLTVRYGWNVRSELQVMPFACEIADPIGTPPKTFALGRLGGGATLATSDGTSLSLYTW